MGLQQIQFKALAITKYQQLSTGAGKRFGTRGSEVRILSPRPIAPKFLPESLIRGRDAPAYAVDVSAGRTALACGGSRRARSSRLREMARLARVIALEVAHHVTQRGNARQFILDSDTERQVYLSLLVSRLSPGFPRFLPPGVFPRRRRPLQCRSAKQFCGVRVCGWGSSWWIFRYSMISMRWAGVSAGPMMPGEPFAAGLAGSYGM